MTTTQLLLNMTLSLSVPSQVIKYLANRKLWEADEDVIREIGQTLASHSDELIYKQPGVTSKLFCQLTKALAWSSFQPGGIRFNGFHYEMVGDKLQIVPVEEKDE